MNGSPRENLGLVKLGLKSGIGDQILIADYQQEGGHHRDSKRRTKSAKPVPQRPGGRGGRLNKDGLGHLGQNDFALGHEFSACAHIKCAVDAAEEMLFELLALLSVELIQKISFRHFVANHRFVVHNFLSFRLRDTVPRYCKNSFRTEYKIALPYSFSPIGRLESLLC